MKTYSITLRLARQILVLSLGCAFLAGCGGGGGGGGGGGSPTLSGLFYSPTGAYLGTGQGTATVFGTASFSIPGGSLSSVTLRVLDSNGAAVSTNTVPVQGSTGGSGLLNATISVSTATLGLYTFEVFATSSSGAVSNTLTGSFRVTNFPWISLQGMPTPRGNVAVATMGSKHYVMGGVASSNTIPPPPVSTVEVYDAATNIWASAANLPMALQGISAAVVGGKIYVLGGGTGTGSIGCGVVSNVNVYDPSTNIWTVKGPIPTPMDSSGTVVIGTQVYLVGGKSGAPCTNNSGVQVYDTVQDTWALVAPLPQAFSQLGASVLGGKIYAFGGSANSLQSGNTALTTGTYDPSVNAWTTFQTNLVGRQNLAVTEVNGIAYLTGGIVTGASVPDNTAYDPATGQLQRKEPLPANVFTSVGGSGASNNAIYFFTPAATWLYVPADDVN